LLDGRFNNKVWLQLSLVVMAGVGVYAWSLTGGFIYDDIAQIEQNPWLREIGALKEIFSRHVWGFRDDIPITNYYRPLMHTFNLLVYQIDGPKPLYFHLLSLSLHLGCCILLYLVIAALQQCCVARLPANPHFLPFAAALIFAVYPANVEAVAWLGSSADLLYTLFSLLSIRLYIQCCDPPGGGRRGWLLGAVGVYLLALLAKETAVPLVPVFVVVYELAGRRIRDAARLRDATLRLAAFLGVLGIYLAVRISVLGSVIPIKNYGLTGWLKVKGTIARLSWYLSSMLWPFDHNFYPEAKDVYAMAGLGLAGAVVLLVAVLVGMIFLCRESRILTVTSVLLVIPLFSALQNYALKVPVAERYLYLPNAVFCLVAALLLQKISSYRLWAGSALVLLVMVLGGYAVDRSLDFTDGLTLWRETATKSPDSVEVREWYARELFAAKKREQGVEQALKAVALGSRNFDNYLHLANGLVGLGRMREAGDISRRMLVDYPDRVAGHILLGRSLIGSGDYVAAIAELELVNWLAPDAGEGWCWLSCAYDAAGEQEKARMALARAKELMPAADCNALISQECGRRPTN